MGTWCTYSMFGYCIELDLPRRQCLTQLDRLA